MDLRQQFRDLHRTRFVIPNPWDVGSARILASLGFPALATTSGGFANALGRLDGSVTREEALEHARQIAAATPLPVSADLENGFGDAPEFVADTIALASRTGLAGCSIEDYAAERGLYPAGLAVDRVRAAVEASRKDASPLVITARCENFLRGNPDLGATIERLQAYQEVGADVLYAPGVRSVDDVRRVVAEVDRPLNVLEAVMEAGGFDYSKADTKRILVIRNENGVLKNIRINLKTALDGKASQPVSVKHSDIIYVPERFQWF